MARRGSRATTREYEFLEARQVVVEPIEVLLKSVNKFSANRAMPWNAEFPAQFEQIVLHLGQAIAHGRRYRVTREYEADHAIRFVDCAVGFYPRAVLGRAAAIAEACRAVVTRSCVDLAQSISHGATIGSGRKPVKKGACLRARLPP